VTKGPKDGWIFWRCKNEKGDWVLLDEVRKTRHHHAKGVATGERDRERY
jgi:hypothetical protein